MTEIEVDQQDQGIQPVRPNLFSHRMTISGLDCTSLILSILEHIDLRLKKEVQAKIEAVWDCPIHTEFKFFSKCEDSIRVCLAIAAPTEYQDVRVGELFYYPYELDLRQRELIFKVPKLPSSRVSDSPRNLSDTLIEFETFRFARQELSMKDEYYNHFWKRIS